MGKGAELKPARDHKRKERREKRCGKGGVKIRKARQSLTRYV